MIQEYSCHGKPLLTIITQSLKPTAIPNWPWQKLVMDFKGPITSKVYFFLTIDEYSKFLEVEIETSTSAEMVIPKLHHMFCTYRIPEEIKIDCGPLFSGKEVKNYGKQQSFVFGSSNQSTLRAMV